MAATVVLSIIGIYVALAIVAIVVVWLKVRWLDPSRIEPASIDALFAERAVLRDCVARLAPLGFVPVAGVRVDQLPTDPRVILLRRAGETAIAVVSAFRKTIKFVVVTEFVQPDASGCSVSVNDSPFPRLEPPLACSRTLRFPDTLPGALWDAFQRVRASEQARGTWRTRSGGDEVDALRRHCERQVAELRERGLLARTGSGPPRLTLRAAALFTLKMLWPWKQVVNHAQVTRARRAAGIV